MEKTDFSPLDLHYGQLRRKKVWLIFLLLAFFISLFLSLWLGSFDSSWQAWLQALIKQGDTRLQAVIWQIRLPRILTGAVVGAAFALIAVVMQNVLRNQLASASTLGVSQGASFAAACSIVLLAESHTPFQLTLFAFLGGLLATMVIVFLSRIVQVKAGVMILAGVAISSFFNGGLSLLQYIADEIQLGAIVYWTLGDLGRTSGQEIGLLFLMTSLAFLYFYFNRLNYNALETGLETAQSLGVNTKQLMLMSLLVETLIASLSTAFVGTISFVGLIAAHIARRLFASDYRFLLAGSTLIGATMMVRAEVLSRSLLAPIVLPIGVLTSFLGAPVFLYLIFKQSGRV